MTIQPAVIQHALRADQLKILQHSLGVDQYGRGRQYRNHYVAGGDDEALCRDLVALGFMQQIGDGKNLCGVPFAVTRAGVTAMHAASPAPPKTTRSQRRYQRWLEVKDAGFETFASFLKYETTQARARRDYL